MNDLKGNFPEGSHVEPSPKHDTREVISKKAPLLNEIPLKPYTLKDLAGIYQVSVPTFKKMLKPHRTKIGWQAGRYFCIAQVRRIFLYIDQPSTYTLKELACFYGVSIPTFKIWLGKFENEIGRKTGHFFSIRQLYIIVRKLDLPSTEGKEKDDLVSLLKHYI